MRNVPMRKCVGCMTSFPKGELVRFVAAGGKAVPDLPGRANGRGVYLCRSMECFDLAAKKKRLSHALRVALTAEDYVGLREKYANELSNAEVCE